MEPCGEGTVCESQICADKMSRGEARQARWPVQVASRSSSASARTKPLWSHKRAVKKAKEVQKETAENVVAVETG